MNPHRLKTLLAAEFAARSASGGSYRVRTLIDRLRLSLRRREYRKDQRFDSEPVAPEYPFVIRKTIRATRVGYHADDVHLWRVHALPFAPSVGSELLFDSRPERIERVVIDAYTAVATIFLPDDESLRKLMAPDPVVLAAVVAGFEVQGWQLSPIQTNVFFLP